MARKPTQLEETLDLPSLSEAIELAQEAEKAHEQEELAHAEEELQEMKIADPDTAETFVDALNKSQDLESRLADQEGLAVHDMEMDDIAKEAMESYRELMDLGMNVTAAHAGTIFTTAQQMLKTSLDAKNSKSDKKLKMWRLQIEQARLVRDLEKERGTGPIEGVLEADGSGVMRIDRNQLLRDILDKPKDQIQDPHDLEDLEEELSEELEPETHEEMPTSINT